MVAEAQDDILPLGKLKQILALCEKEPLGCAFGLTKDKKECMLLVDKRSKPKKVATVLKADGKAHLDLRTIRFGRVEVDVENDPGTLKFAVNRSETGGTIVTLSKLAKRADQSNRRAVGRGSGCEYLHVAIDDRSRLAYTQLLPGERKEDATAFLNSSLAWFNSHGVVVERAMPDNGSAYKSRMFTADEMLAFAQSGG